MTYVCLSCGTTAGLPGNCGCGAARSPAKRWSDYRSSSMQSLLNFNPSCRRICFDLHVNPGQSEIYVVVRVNVNYQQGVTGGAWSGGEKTAFIQEAKAAVSLWDGGVTFARTSTHSVQGGFTPLFFLDDSGSSPHMDLNAVSSAPPQRIDLNTMTVGANGMLQLPPGLVVLRGPYPNNRPVPAAGTRYHIAVQVNRYAPRTYIADNSVPLLQQKLTNTMAHEYGHMFGLPDEYDAYPLPAFSTAGLVGGRVNRGAHNQDKDKTVAFWVELLDECGETSPATWGHVGDDSIMRNIDTQAGSFRRRHYVTILEGLNYLSAHNTNLRGVWSM